MQNIYFVNLYIILNIIEASCIHKYEKYKKKYFDFPPETNNGINKNMLIVWSYIVIA